MTAAVSRFAGGATGHVLVAIAGFAIGGLLVWPLVSGFVPKPPAGDVAMVSCPSNGSRVGVIRVGDQVLVTGRTADGQWVEVQYGAPGLARAYVPAGALSVDGDVRTLPTVDCAAPAGRPSPRASLTAIVDVPPPTAAPTPAATEGAPTGVPTVVPTGSPSPKPTPTPTRPPRATEKPPRAATPTPRRTTAPTKKPTAPPTAPPTATPTPVPDPPVAHFTWDQRQLANYFTIHVTDTSTGQISSWAWDFDNDGTVDSTAQQPANHRYTSTGSKTAKLTVTGPGGSDSATKAIDVPAPEMGPSVVSDTNVYVAGECTDETTITVTSWVGTNTVTLSMIRPDFSSGDYPMSYDLKSRRWRITLDYHQLKTKAGKLFYWIQAVDGSFRDREPENGTSQFNLLDNCVG